VKTENMNMLIIVGRLLWRRVEWIVERLVAYAVSLDSIPTLFCTCIQYQKFEFSAPNEISAQAELNAANDSEQTTYPNT